MAKSPKRPAQRRPTRPPAASQPSAPEAGGQLFDAQLAYFQALQDQSQRAAQRQADAYRDYLAAESATQRDVQAAAAQAYRDLASRLGEIWTTGETQQQALNAYNDYQALLGDLWQREEVRGAYDEAYRALSSTAAGARQGADSVQAYSDAHEKFLGSLRRVEDFDAAAGRVTEALKKYLQAALKAQQDMVRRSQDAWQAYGESLQKLYGDDEQRQAETSLQNYIQSLRGIADQSQAEMADASRAALARFRQGDSDSATSAGSGDETGDTP